MMVVARTQEALRSLSMQFKDRVIRKQYVALVAGVIKKGSGTIEVGLGRHVKERKKISTHTHHAREAVTIFTVKERYPKATLVEVEIKTGRTHQIRVHMAHIGHPVLGDHVYGGGRSTQFGESIITRQMLHAETLSLLHPDTGHPMAFTAPLPADMAEVIDKLRKMKQDEKSADNQRIKSIYSKPQDVLSRDGYAGLAETQRTIQVLGLLQRIGCDFTPRLGVSAVT